MTATVPGLRQKPQQIGSWASLAGFLLIGAGVVALGFLAQHAPMVGAGAATGGQLASHGKAIQIYVTVGLMDWALLYYCWAAVHRRGGNLQTLSGGRWTSWKSVAQDLGIALPFWVLWEATAYGVHWLLALSSVGPGTARTVDSLLPQSPLEVLVWIGVSITAGTCEEMAFRGFLQRQIHALSGSVTVAVLGQGLVFGLFHAYQGWRNVAVISVLGVLYGALAAWRGNLRVNIMTHAWGDVWEGWLKMVVWR
ncbi:MAG TPA: CPBP family intramembrane glutamic endopeptidase [Terracidiphilus sp.]|nr:CPBP family intramembrane glutamic endopeptidase [Terracidiphilus sp.]